jgi:hypothetical protein
MTKVKPTYLDTEILDKIWLDWLAKQPNLTKDDRWQLAKRLGFVFVSRRSNKAQRFEQWLFSQGAEVRKKAGRFYLELADSSDAMLFALRWS